MRRRSRPRSAPSHLRRALRCTAELDPAVRWRRLASAHPRFRLPGTRRPCLARYGKIVAREIKRAEVLLKLVATDEERLAESFKILWQEGTQEDFTLVLQMKGLKRKNQQELLSKVGPLQSAPPTAGSGAAAAGGFGTADFSQSVRGTLDSSAAIFTKMFRKKV